MPRNNGFTLMELICTLAVLSLLTFLGIASTSDLLKRNEQQIILDELNTAIKYAKMQAIHINKPMYLFSLNDQGNWAKGMRLQIRNIKTQQFELIHQWQWHHPQWLISWSGINGSDFLQVPSNPSTAIANGSFDLYNIGTGKHLFLKINRLGRVKSYDIIK